MNEQMEFGFMKEEELKREFEKEIPGLFDFLQEKTQDWHKANQWRNGWLINGFVTDHPQFKHENVKITGLVKRYLRETKGIKV